MSRSQCRSAPDSVPIFSYSLSLSLESSPLVVPSDSVRRHHLPGLGLGSDLYHTGLPPVLRRNTPSLSSAVLFASDVQLVFSSARALSTPHTQIKTRTSFGRLAKMFLLAQLRRMRHETQSRRSHSSSHLVKHAATVPYTTGTSTSTIHCSLYAVRRL